MKNLFVITYCNDPKIFDIVRFVAEDKFIETDLLATNDKAGPFSSMPDKRFFTPAVWKRAIPVKSLTPYKKAFQSTAEFKGLISTRKKVKKV